MLLNHVNRLIAARSIPDIKPLADHYFNEGKRPEAALFDNG